MTTNTIDDYLSWNKILIGINSTAIGALYFKFTGLQNDIVLQTSVKVAALSFLISLITLLIFQSELIDHKNNNSDILTLRQSIVFIVGWTAFMMGFIALSWQIIF